MPDRRKTAPVRLTYLALLSDRLNRAREWQRIVDFARAYGVRPRAAGEDRKQRCRQSVPLQRRSQRRIVDLREERIQGLQTFQEFVERRLAPAMSTCAAVRARQDKLSLHMARATQLLSTRVNIANERQNQGILASMNRRRPRTPLIPD